MKVYLKKLYQNLKGKYRRPAGQWKLWCKRPKTEKERERVIIEAILTQRANWKNVELVMENLKKKNLISLKKILNLGSKRLENEIKSSGFYKTKAKYLISLARFILENYGNINKLMKAKKEELREKMLKLKGVGKETADSILLYSLDKPVFVIDEYTRRLIKREGFAQNLSYNFLQKLFQENLKKDFRLYQDFHALIVIDGKNKK